MSNDTIITLSDIEVRYGKIPALKDFNLELRRGEIHAIVGERRSGKSTIAKLFGGTAHKHAGKILLNGYPIERFTPSLSMRKGIGIIYQDTNLIPSLNAVENIFAGRLRLGFFGVLKQKRMTESVEGFLREWGLNFNLKAPVENLPKAEQYQLELTRAVFFNPEILVFDEISSKLNAEEIETAYRIILDLKNRGKSILYISNNMNEIFEFSDRVSVLKNGSIISTQEISSVDKIKLIDLTYSFASTREELRKRNEELYNYKKYNEDIIKNLPIGVIILDREKNVYLSNYLAIEMFSPDKKNSILDLRGILDSFPGELKEDIRKRIAGSERYHWNEVEFEGSKYLDITVFPFRDEDYVFLGTMLLIKDITKEYQLKNYLLRTERISSIAELAAGVAHEVNNPLGIVQNYVELLKLRHTDEYSVEKIGLIKGELHRIKSIIENLLSFSYLNGTPKVSLDLSALIDDTLLLLDHKMKTKPVEVFWVPPSEAVIITGNVNLLKQVVINLLVNAQEAVEEEGRIEISLKVISDSGYVHLEISDNGAGIPEQDMNKIFNPFFTSKEAGQNTGLGLSICQHIIESHNGLISCSSSDRGTVFSVRLPIYSH